MKTYVRYIIVCLFTLSPAICRAESRNVTHNFESMYKASPRQLPLENPYKTGTTTAASGLVTTYTCNGTNARIFLDLFNDDRDKVIAINLPDNGNFVTTDRISNLQRVEISYYSRTAISDLNPDIMVYISTDGTNWNEPDNITYSSWITATFPAGDYYVKILNANDVGTNNVSILEIRYNYVDLSDCPNCFLYKP